jgi:hypothetical protein
VGPPSIRGPLTAHPSAQRCRPPPSSVLPPLPPGPRQWLTRRCRLGGDGVCADVHPLRDGAHHRLGARRGWRRRVPRCTSPHCVWAWADVCS